MLVPRVVLSPISRPGAVQFHSQFDGDRLDRELWHECRETDPQSTHVGRERVAMGFAGWTLWSSGNCSAGAACRQSSAMSRVVGLNPGWSVGCAVALVLWATGCSTSAMTAAFTPPTHLQRAKVFLAAGDYRRAVEACRQEVQEHPSARSYLYLTYVYQALAAHVESL